jgi:hypothetical protein
MPPEYFFRRHFFLAKVKIKLEKAAAQGEVLYSFKLKMVHS